MRLLSRPRHRLGDLLFGQNLTLGGGVRQHAYHLRRYRRVSWPFWWWRTGIRTRSDA